MEPGSLHRVLLAGILCHLCLLVPITSADTVILTDHNASAMFNTDSYFGNRSWTVNGVEGLFQQWFWYREGPFGAERSIDTLSEVELNKTPPNYFSIQYRAQRFDLRSSFILKGHAGKLPISWLTSIIEVKNTSASPLDFHLFQYSDFDLNGAPAGELVEFLSPTHIRQSESTAVILASVSVAPDRRELSFFPTTRDRLQDGIKTDLIDSTGPYGPGDVTWAFQWDVQIPVGQTFTLVVEESFALPEPASIALFGLAGMLLLRRRRPR